ncbi:MAG: class I SAM-dependent RNA methyltransferase [Chloroflexi bacterium]|nr:MAG: class I SAM-dependent RNA methyltransferase [Chloroflexota bacterium]
MIEHEQSITYHRVTLGALTREGDTVAEISGVDGEGIEQTQVIRVPAGLPGERVTIAIEAAKQRRPGKHRRRWRPGPPRAWITEIHEASPLRRQAPCPVFGTCGGCQLQHMEYEEQLAWKRAIVDQLLREVGGFERPPLLETIACDNPWHYRNHMRFSVNRNGEVGLTARGTHRVLPLARCPIADEQINRALRVISQVPNERPQVLIRCGSSSGQMLIQPQPGPEVTEQLAANGLDIRSDTLEERLAGETFRIRPSSFFQTNTAQAEKMVQMVVKGLASSRTVVDAYCGVGTFALVLARHVEKVIAIEESASAIKDAQWNLREVSNVDILKGKVEDVLPTLAEQIDGLVIDPPRAGCQKVVLDALVQHPVARVVYVSCEPATLARDLHILCHLQSAYHLHSVQPLDMFPQTAHIESVAILERT